MYNQEAVHAPSHGLPQKGDSNPGPKPGLQLRLHNPATDVSLLVSPYSIE